MSNQPMRDKNIEVIVNYFKSGIKPESKKIGIELEHTLVYSDGAPVSYSDEFGQKWILEQFQNRYPNKMIDSEGDLIGLIGSGETEGATITLEPAGQLELSAGPFENLHDAKESFERFEREASSITSNKGIDILTPGYHPTMCAIDLKLIPKKRYEIMNDYLGAISMFGVCMMRGSAATQVAIDYTSIDDCLRKMRLANAASPIFALMCDNSPIFEAEVRKHELVRTEIWEKCDPARCNTVPNVMNDDFTLEQYASYILDTPSMDEQHIVDGKVYQEISDKTFGEIFADTVMTIDDVEHALSMFFNDIRLKTYIEIRPADAMPIDYVIAYAALIKGLFYSEISLRSLESMFSNITIDDINKAKNSLMQNGYYAIVYNHPVSELADELISIAATNLSQDDINLMKPLVTLVANRETLADIALQ